jgi:hypothetical protein
MCWNITISQCAFHCATALNLVAIRPTGKVGQRPQDKRGSEWFGPGDEAVVERLKAKASFGERLSHVASTTKQEHFILCGGRWILAETVTVM